MYLSLPLRGPIMLLNLLLLFVLRLHFHCCLFLSLCLRRLYVALFHFPGEHLLLAHVDPGRVLLAKELKGLDVVYSVRIITILTAHAVNMILNAAIWCWAD